MIVKRFFDNLPREIFEAARLDGAGPFRLFSKIVNSGTISPTMRARRTRRWVGRS